MDTIVLRSVLLVLMVIGFLGMWAWAWSRKRKPDFERAARLPLEEDVGQVPEDTEART